MLSRVWNILKDDGISVINCVGDADITISHIALDLATKGENKFALVADDTDIFVILVYHWKNEMKNIIFYQHKMLRGWNIYSLFLRLDKVKDHILFVHANDRMRHNTRTLCKWQKKLFKPNPKVKDVPIGISNNARCIGRSEWGWRDWNQMVRGDAHIWKKELLLSISYSSKIGFDKFLNG